MRYAPAIRKYLEALLKDSHDAEEVAQDFLLRGLQQGFLRTDTLRGRFRDYLKSAVRHAALNHLRRQRPAPGAVADLAHVADTTEPGTEGDQEWTSEWQRCVLDRSWQALNDHQRRSAGNLFYTVLRLAVDHPGEDSEALAARASVVADRPVRADAFRKQLSRARRLFVELLAAEVAQTLEEPTRERVEEELVEIGLLPYVRDYLPADWRPAKAGPNRK